jgi:hypothetical protein
MDNQLAGYISTSHHPVPSLPVLLARKGADKPRESHGYFLNLWFTIAKARDIFPQG